ncbi:hypothetical protein JIP62_07135 [Brevundimonas vitis]|uniref:Uncharacterized protein n=1 Tax=Brevundimonas vitisensis TaxID=2800818 RepID=A0ABX7BQI2_9CAUL|nr:hypothetical protein [Brevundimonas vitisensis]QQQ19852.1 hypothetical protein JIP62_07135 [Brevundimonas vitisensis]
MHKGASKKQALTAEDLAELVDCYRRIQKLHASLNYASPQQLPLLAASATVKAAWAELSGAMVLGPWAWPSDAVPVDGIARASAPRVVMPPLSER